MKTEVATIDPKEYGLEESEAAEIGAKFLAFKKWAIAEIEKL